MQNDEWEVAYETKIPTRFRGLVKDAVGWVWDLWRWLCLLTFVCLVFVLAENPQHYAGGHTQYSALQWTLRVFRFEDLICFAGDSFIHSLILNADDECFMFQYQLQWWYFKQEWLQLLIWCVSDPTFFFPCNLNSLNWTNQHINQQPTTTMPAPGGEFDLIYELGLSMSLISWEILVPLIPFSASLMYIFCCQRRWICFSVAVIVCLLMYDCLNGK